MRWRVACFVLGSGPRGKGDAGGATRERSMTAVFTFLLYYGSFLVLVFFSCHRLYLLWLLRTHPKPPSCEGNESNRPFVTVQIPVYNERYVVDRLLDSLRRLRY